MGRTRGREYHLEARFSVTSDTTGVEELENRLSKLEKRLNRLNKRKNKFTVDDGGTLDDVQKKTDKFNDTLNDMTDDDHEVTIKEDKRAADKLDKRLDGLDKKLSNLKDNKWEVSIGDNIQDAERRLRNLISVGKNFEREAFKLEVEAEGRGFKTLAQSARELQKIVDETNNRRITLHAELKGKVEVEKGMASLRRDAVELTQRPYELELQGDTTQAIAAFRNASREASAISRRAYVAEIRAETHGMTEAAAEARTLKEEMRALSFQRARIAVELQNLPSVLAGLTAVKRSAEGVEGKYEIRLDTSRLTAALATLKTAPGIVSAITAPLRGLAGHLQNAGSLFGAFARGTYIAQQALFVLRAAMMGVAVVALGPLVAGLGIIVASLGGAAAGFLGLAGAIAPVISQLSNFTENQNKITSAQNAARNSANTLANAERQLGQAYTQVARTQRQGELAVANAVQAHEDSVRGVDQARRQYAQAIRGMQEAEKSGERAITQAIDAHKDAVKQTAQAYQAHRDAVQRAEDAEHQLRQATVATADAQKELSDATKDLNMALATEHERILSMRYDLEGLALSQREIALDMIEAQNDLASADTPLDRERAQLRLQQLQLREKENTLATTQAQRELNQSQAEGTSELQSAYEQQVGAVRGLEDANYSQEQSARGVQEANRGVQDSLVGIQDAITDEQKAYAEIGVAREEAALGLLDAQERVLEAQLGFEDAVRREGRARDEISQAQVQASEQMADALLAVESAQQAVDEALRDNADAMTKLNEAMALVPTQQVVDLRNKLIELKNAWITGTQPAQDALVGLGLQLATLAQQALPYVTAAVNKTAFQFVHAWGRVQSAWSDLGVFESLQTLLAAMPLLTGRWSEAIGYFVGAIINILAIASPYALNLADAVRDIGLRFLTWTQSAPGREAIRRFFAAAAPVAKALWYWISLIGGALLRWTSENPEAVATAIHAVGTVAYWALFGIAAVVRFLIYMYQTHPGITNLALAVLGLYFATRLIPGPLRYAIFFLLQMIGKSFLAGKAAFLLRFAFVAAAGGLFYLAYTSDDTFSAMTFGIMGLAMLFPKTLGGAISWVATTAIPALGRAVTHVGKVWIGPALVAIAEAFGIVGVGASVAGAAIVAIFIAVVDTLIFAFQSFFNFVLPTFDGLWQMLQSGQISWSEFFLAGIRTLAANFVAIIAHMFLALPRLASEALSWLPGAAGDYFGRLADTASSAVQNLRNKIAGETAHMAYDMAQVEHATVGTSQAFKDMSAESSSALSGLGSTLQSKLSGITSNMASQTDFGADAVGANFDQIQQNGAAEMASLGQSTDASSQQILDSLYNDTALASQLGSQNFQNLYANGAANMAALNADGTAEMYDLAAQGVYGNTYDAWTYGDQNLAGLYGSGYDNMSGLNYAASGEMYDLANTGVYDNTYDAWTYGADNTLGLYNDAYANALGTNTDVSGQMYDMANTGVYDNTYAAWGYSNDNLGGAQLDAQTISDATKDGVSRAFAEMGMNLSNNVAEGVNSMLTYMGDTLISGLTAINDALGLGMTIAGLPGLAMAAVRGLSSFFFAEGGTTEMMAKGGMGTQSRQPRHVVWNEQQGNEAWIAEKGPPVQNIGYLSTAASWYGLDVVPSGSNPANHEKSHPPANAFMRDGGVIYAQAGYVDSLEPHILGYAEEIYKQVGGGISYNTYPGHPAGWPEREPYSVDFWGPGGRGDSLENYDYGVNTGWNIVSLGQKKSDFSYYIWQGTDSMGGVAAAEDPHMDHVHITWMGDLGLGGGTGVSMARVNELIAQYIPQVPDVGSGVMANMSEAVAGQARAGVVSLIQSAASRFTTDVSGDIDEWISKGIQAGGVFTDDSATHEAIKSRAMQESGGDPNAINDWDSNALAGTPSKGLMQIIEPTWEAWRAYAGADMGDFASNWSNPIKSVAVATRYMKGEYGGPVGATGVGYANGGIALQPHMGLVGEAGPEMMIPLDDTQAVSMLTEAVRAAGTGDAEGQCCPAIDSMATEQATLATNQADLATNQSMLAGNTANMAYGMDGMATAQQNMGNQMYNINGGVHTANTGIAQGNAGINVANNGIDTANTGINQLAGDVNQLDGGVGRMASAQQQQGMRTQQGMVQLRDSVGRQQYNIQGMANTTNATNRGVQNLQSQGKLTQSVIINGVQQLNTGQQQVATEAAQTANATADVATEQGQLASEQAQLAGTQSQLAANQAQMQNCVCSAANAMEQVPSAINNVAGSSGQMAGAADSMANAASGMAQAGDLMAGAGQSLTRSVHNTTVQSYRDVRNTGKTQGGGRITMGGGNYAGGGITKRPQISVMGEAGREMAMPLDDPRAVRLMRNILTPTDRVSAGNRATASAVGGSYQPDNLLTSGAENLDTKSGISQDGALIADRIDSMKEELKYEIMDNFAETELGSDTVSQIAKVAVTTALAVISSRGGRDMIDEELGKKWGYEAELEGLGK